MKTTAMILLSHALTDWNVQQRIQGHRDVPLNKTGRQMAGLLARRLSDLSLQAIYSSDLSRAWQTAEPTARQKGLKIIQDMRLREGRSINQEKDGEYPLLAFKKDWETEEDVLKRMSEALGEIAEKESGKRILVVSHAKAIELFIRSILLNTEVDPELYLGKRSALNSLEYFGGTWKVKKLNDDDYLHEINLF